MNEIDVDANELERQRYDAIKKSGEYLELKILIGTEKDSYKNHEGKAPVISTHMHGCGSEEIGSLYIILKSMIDHYKKKYPVACLLADLTMDCKNLGTIECDIETDENNKDGKDK